MCKNGHRFSGDLVFESIGLTPNSGVSTMPGDVHSGDTATTANQVKKEGDEYNLDNREERREIKIADKILRAASGLAKSPVVDEIVNQARELKRIHGVV